MLPCIFIYFTILNGHYHIHRCSKLVDSRGDELKEKDQMN